MDGCDLFKENVGDFHQADNGELAMARSQTSQLAPMSTMLTTVQFVNSLKFLSGCIAAIEVTDILF